MKKIAILGASGSIGTNTLDVIRKNKDKFDLVAFSVYSKIEIIEKMSIMLSLLYIFFLFANT